MTLHHRHREFALIKVADDVLAGEQFWIINLDLVRGVVARSEASVDASTAVAQFLMLGCDTHEIAQLLMYARRIQGTSATTFPTPIALMAHAATRQ